MIEITSLYCAVQMYGVFVYIQFDTTADSVQSISSSVVLYPYNRDFFRIVIRIFVMIPRQITFQQTVFFASFLPLVSKYWLWPSLI